MARTAQIKLLIVMAAALSACLLWLAAKAEPARAILLEDCTITGTEGSNLLEGTEGPDVICGLGGGDTIRGLGGNDILIGFSGNDQLVGGAGDDSLDGGSHIDAAHFSGSTVGVTASLVTNQATGEGSDSMTNIENLTGSEKNDSLTGNASTNNLSGRGGSDQLFGLEGADRLVGGVGDDTLRGGSGDDTVIANGGFDDLFGEEGDDLLDSREGVAANDALDGGTEADTCTTDATEEAIVSCEVLKALRVESVTPAEGAKGVSVATDVAAIFSDEIDASTINETTFTLTKQGGTALMQGVVDYDAATKTAWLHRSGDLQPNATYVVTVKGGTNGVKDLAGNPLAADKTWSFTTAAEDTDTPPTATIEAPSSTTTWAVGDIINYSGSATDEQDGELPASNLSWEVIMHHCSDISCTNSHEHWIAGFAGVASGQFTAPDHDYPVFLEFRLTATDPEDETLTGTDSVYLHPKTVELSFRSEPSGLELGFGGDSKATPFERTVIVGSKSSIDAPSPQSLGGVEYEFLSWSDGEAQSHNITAGTQPATYTATYQQPDTSAPEVPMVEGLKAEYDDDAAYGGGTDFDVLHTTRIDPTVDFSWGTGAPAAGMGADDFAIRWSGEVYIPEAGDTTFYVASNDGHRLYIDDTLKLDNWKTGNFTGSGEKNVTLNLSAGWHRIEVYQFEGVNNAAAKLSYDPAGAEAKQVIPSNRLRSGF